MAHRAGSSRFHPHDGATAGREPGGPEETRERLLVRLHPHADAVGRSLGGHAGVRAVEQTLATFEVIEPVVAFKLAVDKSGPCTWLAE